MGIWFGPRLGVALCLGVGASVLVTGCSGGGGGTSGTPHVTSYTLTVASVNPTSGAAITASPADVNGTTTGTTSFSLQYAAGTTVTLTAPSLTGKNGLSSWTGCGSASGQTCTVTVNANATVTANYVAPGVSGVTVGPNPAAATVGGSLQMTATVTGVGSFDNTVAWTVTGPSGWTGGVGTVSTTGLYQTPYPAPPSVTLTATSNADNTKSGSQSVTLQMPATAAGPALMVDAGNQVRAISPLIYGMNEYQIDSSVAKLVSLPVDRWGGDATTRYNYKLDVTNAAGDWYFETLPNTNTAYPDVSDFNTQVTQDEASQTLTLGTVPLIGWTTLRQKACGFSVAKYGAQQKTDQYWTDCGNGLKTDGKTKVTGNNPADTSTQIDESFVKGWVQYLVGKFGDAAHGGVAIYDLDNEPEWWFGVHQDVHPLPITYDEITSKGLSYAAAVKAADPTAAVMGPVISNWMDFFYSMNDITTGWGTGPCYCGNGNPVDRLAHGDVPLMDYYLQQFKKYDDTNHARLLDYVDIHAYFAANNGAFTAAGDTAAQAARLNSTRVFWDATYTDPQFTDPNNRTSSAKPYPPQLITLLHQWVTNDYPGTKTSITEYNWGGQEHINGALAQADILGIFGREGLDLATLWGPPDPKTQVPGLTAFLMYRNYDGGGSKFGDVSLASTSANQGQLSVYGAIRTVDNSVTVMVINKGYADVTSQLSLANFTPAGKAKVFQYSNANLNAITSLADQTVTAPTGGGTTSLLTATFPAQSITLFVVPKM
jgi:Glycoside hydrolase family 44